MKDKSGFGTKSIFFKVVKGIYITFGLIPLLVILALIVFVSLYIIKTWLGIDLFPDIHLFEFFE